MLRFTEVNPHIVPARPRGGVSSDTRPSVEAGFEALLH
jgi:hypothetical protein